MDKNQNPFTKVRTEVEANTRLAALAAAEAARHALRIAEAERCRRENLGEMIDRVLKQLRDEIDPEADLEAGKVLKDVEVSHTSKDYIELNPFPKGHLGNALVYLWEKNIGRFRLPLGEGTTANHYRRIIAEVQILESGDLCCWHGAPRVGGSRSLISRADEQSLVNALAGLFFRDEGDVYTEHDSESTGLVPCD